MAKLPGYLKSRRIRLDSKRVVCDLCIRWWHPGAWLALARGWGRSN
jgi:hypothetical protein